MNLQPSSIQIPSNRSAGLESPPCFAQSPLMPRSPKNFILAWLQHLLRASKGSSTEDLSEFKELIEQSSYFNSVASSDDLKILNEIQEAYKENPDRKKINQIAQRAFNTLTSTSPRSGAGSV